MTKPDQVAGGVLLVTRNFPPLLGGMERVNLEMARAIASRWPLQLVGPDGCAPFAPSCASVREVPLRSLARFVVTCAFQVLAAVRRRPELVLAGSGLTAPMAWLAAKRAGARSAVYLHGLDVIVPSRIYQWVWLPFIRRCDLVLVNSANTGRLAVQRGVPAERVEVLNPGTMIPVLDRSSGSEFRVRASLGQGPLLLSVGRLTRRKGLAEFVANALPVLVQAFPGVVLAVIGGEAENALHGVVGGERKRIEAAAGAAGVGAHVRFLERVTDEQLREAYCASDCHIFPVLEVVGDIEGFGMVALEAAAHGLPTVAFAVGGIPDAVEDQVTGSLVPAGDYANFVGAVSAILSLDMDKRQVQAIHSRRFAERFSWPRFGQRLIELLESAMASGSR